MERRPLPGLERLLEVSQRLELFLLTTPPGQVPPVSGTRLGGHPLDPMLTAFYARFGKAVFASDIAGMGLFQLDDTVNELEARNEQWRRDWQARFPMPLFVFGGETGLACYYATVPGLADASGRQPVVLVDTYEAPHALPVASDVDRFFDLYARYLETLVAHPDFAEEGSGAVAFPWDMTGLLAQDTRLVELMRAGCFDALLPDEVSARKWVDRVVGTHG